MRKQAVLLIHGIGEQRPMDTLRGLVDTVWTSDSQVHNPYAGATLWSKPDFVSEGFELRRLTTPRNASGVRTDFFEFYWAHLMHGTSYGHLVAWARSLLWRRPSTVPAHLRGIYWLLLTAVAVAITLAVYGWIAAASDGPSIVPAWVSVLMSLAVLPLVGGVLLGVVGDAARYLHVAPANVQRRHEIRQAGVKILNALNEQGYERIVVVGHSLGSVIGYDILYHSWAAVHKEYSASSPTTTALDAVESQVVSPNDADSPATFRRAQRAYLKELQANGTPWCVTDFVTLGSPLTHAAILLAADAADLASKQRARELPTCPPCTESVQRGGKSLTRFSYEPDNRRANAHRVPHHAALFAATRWTNLYFPSRFVIWGDVIGGPLAPWFGRGIHDVAVRTGLRLGLFVHTCYWKRPERGDASHIDALRDALNLVDR